MLKNLMLVVAALVVSATTVSAEQLSEQEFHCLALNVYHEARGESAEGQLAVAHVTLNRVASSKFPNTICAVVKQAQYKNGQPVLNKCQFHWYCDGKSDKIYNQRDWKAVVQNTTTAVKWYTAGEDFSNGALFYHTNNMTTSWSRKFSVVAEIGAHVFFDGVIK